MDSYLFSKIYENLPKMNPLLCNGIAGEQVKFAEEYIDKVIKSAEASFPPQVKYLGYKICTPNEEYAELSRDRYSKQQFDIARSDFYMVKYVFTFTDPISGVESELPPRYIQIPFLDTADTIKIRGSQFVVNPVIADELFSIDYETIFLPVTRDKLIFERLSHGYLTNGQRRTPSLAWGNIHSIAKKRNSLTTPNGLRIKPVTTMGHYIFAKYGLTEAFKRFANAEIHVGTSDINIEKYPTKDWIICQCLGTKPTTVSGRNYQASDIKIAIHIKDYNQMTDMLLGSFFYVVDHFPDRIMAEYVNETALWRIVLGHIIYKNGESEGKLLDDVNHHIKSLDEYIDSIVLENFDAAGLPCKDIYQLFAYIMENMTSMIIATDVASMYGKRLIVLRYLLLDVVKGIFNMAYALTRKANNAIRPLTENDVRKTMDRYFKTTAILSSITSQHGEVNTVSSPGDNKFLKITSRVILQSLATGKQQKTGLLKDPSKYLHSSLAEVGSYGNQPKFDPTGQSRINPYLNVTVDGTIRPNPEHKELLDNVSEKIKRI